MAEGCCGRAEIRPSMPGWLRLCSIRRIRPIGLPVHVVGRRSVPSCPHHRINPASGHNSRSHSNLAESRIAGFCVGLGTIIAGPRSRFRPSQWSCEVQPRDLDPGFCVAFKDSVKAHWSTRTKDGGRPSSSIITKTLLRIPVRNTQNRDCPVGIHNVCFRGRRIRSQVLTVESPS